MRTSRRRLLVASGATLAAGSSTVLAACGATEEEDEEISASSEAGLLNVVLAQQLAVRRAAVKAEEKPPDELKRTIRRLRSDREGSVEALQDAIDGLDAAPPTTQAATKAGAAESPVEGLAEQLEAAIAATLKPVAELRPSLRQHVHRAITEDAAALAAIRASLDEEIALDAFVMGRPPAGEDDSA